MNVFVQNKSIFPFSREIASIIVITTRQKCKKPIDFHHPSVQKKKNCYDDRKEASMSDHKWLKIRVTD